MGENDKSSNSSVFCWGETKNPAPPPDGPESQLWRTKNAGSATVSWSSSNTNVVTVSPRGEHGKDADVIRVGVGWATITASLENDSSGQGPISRTTAVGELFIYRKASTPAPRLYGARSDMWWVQESTPTGIPTFSEMADSDLAYSEAANPHCVILNLPKLRARITNLSNRTYLLVERCTSSSSLSPPTEQIPANVQTYAYAPDGTLWKVAGIGGGTDDWSAVHSVPQGFPTQEKMIEKNAGLMWEPEHGEAAGTAAAPPHDASVTCFVMNIQCIPSHMQGVITHYLATPIQSEQ